MTRPSGKTLNHKKAEQAEDIENPIQDEEVLEFIRAIDDYRRKNNRPFPSWSEILLILHSLGYKRAETSAPESKEG